MSSMSATAKNGLFVMATIALSDEKIVLQDTAKLYFPFSNRHKIYSLHFNTIVIVVNIFEKHDCMSKKCKLDIT